MQRTGKIRLRVWGEYACFSRPEFKVERVSYPVITPSAARGVLEAVFWKPEIRYEIRRIGILKLGTQTVILRNELKDRQGDNPFFIEDKRQQRSSLILKDVEYLIEADAVLRPHATEPIGKYLDQFNRKAEKGQCHHTPYLGTREFAAAFEPANGETPPPLDLPIGSMLFDIAFVEDASRAEMEFKRPKQDEPAKGYAQASFFEAAVKEGWLEVPPEKYRELYRLESDHV
ncbi:MAG: type I-C CRISPR-associated protein Cas5 [Hydrogenophilaceae bacterium]|nr:type I-C CRISPR-associated protein Cas5 [Hydrogenophilaceae bacterium]